MIGPSGAVCVMVASRPVNFGKGAERLVRAGSRDHGGRSVLGYGICGSVPSVRAGSSWLVWDCTGRCLFAKRLEDGIFRWPKVEDGVMRLSAAQLSALLEGLDWRRVHEARETRAADTGGLMQSL